MTSTSYPCYSKVPTQLCLFTKTISTNKWQHNSNPFQPPQLNWKNAAYIPQNWHTWNPPIHQKNCFRWCSNFRFRAIFRFHFAPVRCQGDFSCLIGGYQVVTPIWWSAPTPQLNGGATERKRTMQRVGVVWSCETSISCKWCKYMIIYCI